MIKFRCIECQKKVGVADAAAGKRARCPACKAVMRVPQPEPVPAAAEVEPVMQLAPEDPTPRPERPTRERRRTASAVSEMGDFTVAGQVLAGVAGAPGEREAQLERRARQDAMDSLAGLDAVEASGGSRLMSFGSSMAPALKPRSKKRRSNPDRRAGAVRPACRTCGTEAATSARFCTGCGAPLAVPELPVDAGTNPIALPMVAPPKPAGWRSGLLGWLLGARRG